jgi:hypothetical protein
LQAGAGETKAPDGIDRRTIHSPVNGGFGLKPILVVNPVSDAAFVNLANEMIAEAVPTPVELQDRLRNRYPRAVVRPRVLSGEPIEIWYVYREGYWIRAEDVGEAGGTEEASHGSPR